MASRKDELNKAKEAGKSIVEKQAASNKEEKPNENTKPKGQSLVANQFGAKKEKTWNDVKSEYNNDPVKIADYLNNATDYTPGNLTKKGMEGFGYSQGADGKWAPKPKDESTTETNAETSTTDTSSSTTDTTTSEIEKLKKENEEFRKQLESLQNPKTGKTDGEGAKSISDEHMKKGLEIGALTLDKDGKYVLTNVNKKGWEDWATIASAGLSVLGLALGVPIIPINFRKITNKDEKDEAIREFQKQLTDISASNLAKVKDVESSKEAGDYIKKNQDSIDAFTNYAENTAAYGAKSDIDTDKETKLINEKLKAEQLLAEAAFKNKVKEMKLSHDQRKDLETLMSDLSTDSAKELLNQEKYRYLLDFVKEAEAAGIDDRAIALKLQALASETPTSQNLKHAKTIVGMIKDLGETASSFMSWK